MQSIANKYLKIIDLIQLENWSVQGLLDSKFNYSNKYEQARIGDFLIRSRNIVDIEDGKEYYRVTVKINNNGVILRDTEKGVNIGTKKQYRASAGQFIISKIDARNGAFGIIPNELHNAIVTNDFPLFDINTKKINPQFLLLITTTKVFIKFAQSCSSGTTNRQRMDIDMFLNQKIPLPSLSEQEVIVNNYYSKIKEAEALEKQANDLEGEIEKYFRGQLGFDNKRIIKYHKGLNFVEFENLERWDGKINSDINSNYTIEKIGKYIVEISTGTTPPTSRPEYFDGDINFYTPVELGEDMFLTSSDRKVSKLAFTDKKARRFEKGTLLFVGIGSTVGKIGIVANEYASSNQQITGFKVDETFLLNEFVFYYFNYFKEITTKEQTKATLPIVNQDKILNIPIPLLPIPKQQEIIKTISLMRQQIFENKVKLSKIIIEAEQEFEQEIFKS